MDIAERAFNGIGPWTIRGQPQPHKPGVTGQPLLDGFGFMHTVVVDNDRDTGHFWGWIHRIQPRQEVSKYPSIFARTETLEHLPRRKLQRSSQIVLLVRTRC